MTGALCPFSNSARHWEHSKRWLAITSSSPLVTHNGERVVRTGAVGDVELDAHESLLPRRRASRLGTAPFPVLPNSTSQGCCKLRNSALRQARAKPTREAFSEHSSCPGRPARDNAPFQGDELTICFAETAYGPFRIEPGFSANGLEARRGTPRRNRHTTYGSFYLARDCAKYPQVGFQKRIPRQPTIVTRKRSEANLLPTCDFLVAGSGSEPTTFEL